MREAAIILILTLTTTMMCNASSIPTPPPPRLHMTSSPASLTRGLTDTLTINCSLPGQQHQQQQTQPSSSSELSILVSIILSKDGLTPGLPLTEIASVTSAQGNRPDLKNTSLSSQATAEGHIHGGGGYLAVVVQNPGVSSSQVVAAGRYRCSAFGVDAGGHPVTVQGEVTVVREEPSVDSLLAHVAVLKERLKSCNCPDMTTSNIISTTAAAAQSTTTTARTPLITSSTTPNTPTPPTTPGLDKTLPNSNITLASLPQHNGHYYYIANDKPRSQQQNVNASLANQQCHLYGGYLIEVNDEAELNFTFTIVRNTGSLAWVFIGTEKVNGKWKYMSSEDDVTYFHWLRPGGPQCNNNQCSCMSLGYINWQGYGWGMDDMVCSLYIHTRFICEFDATHLL